MNAILHSVTPTRAPSMLSVITATHPARLSKRFTIDSDGALIKEPGGALVRGAYQRKMVDGPAELARLVGNLRPNQALAFGVADVDSAPIASCKARREGEITRTREHFDWPAGSGWLLIDYDPLPGAEPMRWDALCQVLREVWPAFADAPAVAIPSGSAYIYNGDQEMRGPGGLRAWVEVADARDIPRAGRVLFERLWLAGHGCYAVSKSGALLERGPIDAAVWQPERLDFAAGASCEPPLIQRRPNPIVRNHEANVVCTTTTLLDLTESERLRLDELREQARLAVAGRQARAREQWIGERMGAWETNVGASIPKDRHEASRERARRVYGHAAERLQLFAEFELRHETGKTVTVADLHADPDRWHGQRFADPLEPDYGNDPRIAWVNLRSGGRPYLFSHAHGGQRFELMREVTELAVSNGEMPQLIATGDRILANAGEVYQRGGQLVRLLPDASLITVTGPWLRTHLETLIRFTRLDGRSKKWNAIDCPSELHTRIMHWRGDWSMHELQGVVRAPILRPDGSLLLEPGYDAVTGLLLLADHPDGWPPIHQEPTHAQVRAALQALWEPFELFPFKEPIDRAVTLAACLTSVQRALLPTAPAFLLDSPKAGSGKTKCANAICLLSGNTPAETSWSHEPEEQRKKLTAKLVSGPSSLLIDNVTGVMTSDTLNAILTSPRYEDRLLGTSQTVTVPTQVLVLITGNNARVGGDLSRRVLVSSIDHGVESPERLAFPFDPVARMRERWLHYRVAALTILRGFVTAGKPAGGAGSVGSFEDWDAMIRQCVVWIRDHDLAPFMVADPADAINRNYEHDPETQKLAALLEALHAVFGGRTFTVKEAISKAHTVSQFNPELRGDEACAALEAALEEIAAEGPHINPRRLGRWIERFAGRILNGKRLVREGSRQGVALWTVQEAQ